MTDGHRERIAVRNPLTVIAIFAGLAETAGTIVLPFVSEANQDLYVWFLMLFPIMLVVFFFLTLNFNPKVLYAPSDFVDESNYMDLFRPSTAQEKLAKLETDLSENEQPGSDTNITQTPNQEGLRPTQSSNRVMNIIRQNPHSKFIIAEAAIVDKLARELGAIAQREVVLQSRFGSQMFDAVLQDDTGLVLVEVRILYRTVRLKKMRETFEKVQAAVFALPEEVRQKARLIIAIAYEIPEEQVHRVRAELNTMKEDYRVNTEVRMYKLDDLMDEMSELTS